MCNMYADYPVKPYINPSRDLSTENSKPVPRRNMELLDFDLTAGDIILLWRIGFGTFTNESWFPKYFEYTYGINASERLAYLIENGFAYKESAFDSLNHVKAEDKRTILKSLGIKGISKMTVRELDSVLAELITEEELGTCFAIRGIALTERGRDVLESNQAVVDRHPQKKF